MTCIDSKDLVLFLFFSYKAATNGNKISLVFTPLYMLKSNVDTEAAYD